MSPCTIYSILNDEKNQALICYKKLKQNNKHIYFSVRDDNIHGLSDGDLEVILDWLDTNI